MKRPEGIPFSLALLLSLFLAAHAGAGTTPAPFDSTLWVLDNAAPIDTLGKSAITGFAYMKDLEFEDGVIEVDLYVTGATSYPGVLFRMESQGEYERIYLRPHRLARYGDVVQYTPVFNGIAGWQLYNGDGLTAGAELPENRWFLLRVEVSGRRARVFLDQSPEPVLTIHDLKRGEGRGSIGFLCPGDGTAYLANFRYSLGGDLSFGPTPLQHVAPGAIRSWELAGPFAASSVDLEGYPESGARDGLEWRPVEAEPTGLLDIARFAARTGREPDCVYARATLTADADELFELQFGYSDAVTLFLNGKLVFSGNSSYRGRDPSFLGVIGYNDAVYLPLERGENEILFLVVESFGGWGLMCRNGDALFAAKGVKKEWESEKVFRMPESALYDPYRRCCYVSNYDGYGQGGRAAGQFLTKISMDGSMESLRWAEGLTNPTGLAVTEDAVYVVERTGVARIDPETGEILEKHRITGARFINDMAVDTEGRLYISDSGANAIYRIAGGVVEQWLDGEEVNGPNGLHVHGARLIYGNNGDHFLKAARLSDGRVERIADLGEGTIDGITADRDGNYIVSHWEGRVFRVTPAGQVEKLLDTTVPGAKAADIGLVADQGLLLVPTFFGNSVAAYRLAPE